MLEHEDNPTAANHADADGVPLPDYFAGLARLLLVAPPPLALGRYNSIMGSCPAGRCGRYVCMCTGCTRRLTIFSGLFTTPLAVPETERPRFAREG